MKKPNLDYSYTIFVNGSHICTSTNYDETFQRGLGIAMYLKLDFVNTKSLNIIDKWVNKEGTNQVIITKDKSKFKVTYS